MKRKTNVHAGRIALNRCESLRPLVVRTSIQAGKIARNRCESTR